MFWLFVVFLVTLGKSDAVHLPKYLVPCSLSHNFSTCAIKHAEDAIPHLLKGDRKLGLPSFTPLEITRIEVKGASNFKIILSDLKVYGLENVKPLKLEIDHSGRQAKIYSTIPRLVVLGEHNMSGRILFFDLDGHGPFNITLTDGIYEYSFSWTLENRDGEDYGKIIDSSFDYSLKGVHYYFGNIINGQEVLSNQINDVLNENWEAVNEDLKESIKRTLLIIHNQLFEKVFSNVPYHELFLK